MKKLKIYFDKIDDKIINFLKKISLPSLRYSLAIIFIWFGSLKIVGMSSAQELVTNTVYWFSPQWFVPFLGWWEVLIGVCLLYKPLIRLGLFLLSVQMIGTFLPLVILPEVIYGSNIYNLTLEGQYIIKNLILISAGIAIGSNFKE